MLFLIRFSVFQKKQNTAISVNTARDIRLSKKSEDYHTDLLHKTSRVAEFSASGYHSPEKYSHNIAPHALMDRAIVRISCIVDINHTSAPPPRTTVIPVADLP